MAAVIIIFISNRYFSAKFFCRFLFEFIFFEKINTVYSRLIFDLIIPDNMRSFRMWKSDIALITWDIVDLSQWLAEEDANEIRHS